MSAYEDGRTNLEKLIEWYSSKAGSRNESTTRLQMIDLLLFECLGWSKDDAVCEEPHGGDFADYTLSAPRRILIVEAKKEGDYFELPAEKHRLEYALSSLTRDFESLRKAIQQCAGYCQTRGVPFAVVTNGHQMVAFIATRSDGLPPLEGKALVFTSLDSMLANFHDFWQALSKPGVEEKHLLSRLIGGILPDIPPKLSTSIALYPGVKARNPFQTDLQTLSELLIEDLVRSKELRKRFLDECYSRSGALSQYALVSKTILQTRYAALFAPEEKGPTTVPAVDKEGISAELLAESLSRRPIILIGDVGVGKTTFIRYLINVEAAPIFEKAITLYIDLGSQATLAYDLRRFLLDEISRQLREDHNVDLQERNFVRYLYRPELDRFAKGIYSDLRETHPEAYKLKEIEFLDAKISNEEVHLRLVLQHIAKARKKQVILFIDNADQRDETTQQEAFLIAQEIAEHWHPVTVFVALRPETFYRSLHIGALSGYHPKAFTILPPRIDRVIERRLRFALKITNGEIPMEVLPGGIEVKLQNLGEIIAVFLQTLERSGEISECIVNVAGGNVRLALDLVREFFGSGHVDTEKIIRIYEESGTYYIPLHEFLRAIIYGDAEHFDPDQAPVANLYDLSTVDGREHFLLPLMLGLLASASDAEAEQGFVETAKLYQQLQGFGFTPEQIDNALIRADRGDLIETAARRIPQPGKVMPQTIRITTVGSYHTTRLARQFSYNDAVVVDTPVLDVEVRTQITDVRSIADRLNRAEIFRKYLDGAWVALKETDARHFFDWEAVSNDLRQDIDRIRTRI
jgi:hypothetical protein